VHPRPTAKEARMFPYVKQVGISTRLLGSRAQ